MKTKVCVVGLGQVGLPTAQFIAERGYDVWGFDIAEEAIHRGQNSGIKATIKWDEIPQANVYVICVSTSLINNNPDVTAVFNVCKKIARKAEEHSLVSIESTVALGTCRKINEEIFGCSYSLIHVPHRFWAGDPEMHGVRQARVIGGVNSESLERGVDFYHGQLGIPLHKASTIEVAEMSKVAENAYRYVQIAFAEELRMICEQSGLDFQEVRNACKTKWNIEIMEAREGIEGHCLPKDIRYLASLSKNDSLLEPSIFTDNMYREWLKRRRKIAVIAPR